ncbi:hypothetical protein [Paraliomyxa miuraensis]|uniref:hypothetical protein n=1 Tax=Paraliomyxa miuraensis TaxID=376150 RepID=UPI0022537D72|nr:hypothetical protein [Paraliomyxa miuraensis]MCX4242448.1 hypothetical protein [Paraliomyxa miuraensis]
MIPRDVSVLLGDSTPSELPANILDTISEVVHCARDVATAFAEIEQLELRRAESSKTTEAIVEELGSFGRQTEVGIRATAGTSRRSELKTHGEEVIAAVNAMILGWRQQYERKLQTSHAQIAARTTELRATMRGALERYLVPRRVDAPLQRFHRIHDGQRYLDSATVEPLSGVRVTVTLADPEVEVPRRIRSLLGKGHKIQVGTRRARLRRTEEPVYQSLDDQLLLEAERGPGRLRVVLARKPGVPEMLRVEIKRGDAALAGQVIRGEGEGIASPIEDLPVLEALWRALDAERDRILGCPAQLAEVSLDSRPVDGPGPMLAVAERLIQCHRPTVAVLARHSPNPAELSIKLVTGDGKREEAWVRRDELAQHLLGLPGPLRKRMGMPELHDGVDDDALAEAKTGVHQTVGDALGGVVGGTIGELLEDESLRIELEPADGVPGAPVADLTQDISLGEVLVEIGGSEDSGCIDATRVRLR